MSKRDEKVEHETSTGDTDQVDADRYRWVRLQPPSVTRRLHSLSPAEFDRVVDEGRATTKIRLGGEDIYFVRQI